MTATKDIAVRTRDLDASELLTENADEQIDLVDLVAQAVADRFEEHAHEDVFFDHVFARLNSWQISSLERTVHGPEPSPDRRRDVQKSNAIQVGDYHTPLIYKYDGDEISQLTTRMLVSCLRSPLDGGGVFELDLGRNRFRKVVECDGRGIARFEEGYIVASRDKGLFVLSNDLTVIDNHRIQGLDLHGVQVGPDGLLYVVETKHNRVGIYQLDPFSRVGEIVVSPDVDDRNHVNDLCFVGNKLLLSMFSTQNVWRENTKSNIFDGAIVEYDIEDRAPINTIYSGLKMPHTVKVVGQEICYCESFSQSVFRSGEKIAQYSGYTRGLDVAGQVFLVGQSKVRHRRRKTELTLSGDAGLHVFMLADKVSRFISMPTTDVYGVHILY